MRMRLVIRLSFVIFVFFNTVGVCATTVETKTETPVSYVITTPAQALAALQKGNDHFVAELRKNQSFIEQMKYSQTNQTPFAVILSCMDSRTSPEIVFDQGIGDLFSQRVAGNVLNQNILGGMEYATKVVGAELIVVMAHENCGALKAACEKVQLGNLTPLLQSLQPVVAQTAKTFAGGKQCDNPAFINSVAKQNVLDIMQAIPEQSPIIANLVKHHHVMIVGAMLNLSTGKVEFFTH